MVFLEDDDYGEELKKLKTVGLVAAQLLDFAISLCRPSVKLLEIAEKTEEKLDYLNKRTNINAKFAFPINLSLNNIAAHFSPQDGDVTIIGEQDMLKIDIGIHLDGSIVDMAATISFSKGELHHSLIRACNEALITAIKLATPEREIWEIGKAIEEVILSYGFVPIKNLSGHEIRSYMLHSGLTIPNYNNNSRQQLKENQIIAIEPFATISEGVVKEGMPSSIYRVINEAAPLRDINTKKLAGFIKENFLSLPFSKRWLLRNYQNPNLSLTILEKMGYLIQYKSLIAKDIVAQAEHTVIVKDKPIVLTKLQED